MKIRNIFIVLVAIVTLFIIPTAASAAQTPNEATISYTAAESDSEECVSAATDITKIASVYKTNTPEAYTVYVTLRVDLCTPIFPRAAVYSMPSSTVAWPQELVSVKTFELQQAGLYTIRFDKTCGPEQFDVINGRTPQKIAPWGEWHGPLLWPVVNDNAYQHFGSVCQEETTTTTTTTTTTSVPTTATTTTVPTSVLGTTVQRIDDPSSTTASVQVAGISAQSLPVTGSDAMIMILISTVLIATGSLFIVATRRRKLLSK